MGTGLVWYTQDRDENKYFNVSIGSNKTTRRQRIRFSLNGSMSKCAIDSKVCHGNLKNGNNKKWGSIQFSFWLLTSEHSLTQISNCLSPSLVVPVGGEETFILTNKPQIAEKILFLSWKRKKKKFWSGTNLLYTFCILHAPFQCQIQIIVASFGSLVTLHQVHNFNDLHPKVVEQWSPPRDLEVSEVSVQKTQLVAGLEISVGLNMEQVGEGRRLTR